MALDICIAVHTRFETLARVRPIFRAVPIMVRQSGEPKTPILVGSMPYRTRPSLLASVKYFMIALDEYGVGRGDRGRVMSEVRSR